MGCASSVESQPQEDKSQSEGTQPSHSLNQAEGHHQKHVTKREAREAFNALATSSISFKPIKLLKVGQALKDSVGSSNWKPFNEPPQPEDLERAAKAIVKFRDQSGIVRSDGSFLQEAFGVQSTIVELAHQDVRSLKLPASEDALDSQLQVHTTISQGMGLYLDELAVWMSRLLAAADCLVMGALAGCELHGDPALSLRPQSSTVAAAVNASASRLFQHHGRVWEAILETHATTADDVASVFEGALTPIIQRVPPRYFRAGDFLRSAVRTATSLLHFVHGGRKWVASYGAFSTKSPVSRLYLKSISSITEKFWNYCAHPNGGMELTRKVDDEATALMSYLAFLGAIPCAPGNLNSVGLAASHFLGPAVSPAATCVVLYIVAILTTQFRLDIKNISRPSILRQASEALQAVVVRAAQTAVPVSSKVFPTFQDEAGEGHGPRKEFFDLLAQALTSPHAPTQKLRGVALVDGVSGSTMLRLRPTTPGSMETITKLCVAGNILELNLNSVVFTATVLSVRKDVDSVGVRIAAPLPDDCDGIPLDGVKKLHKQCFAAVSFDSHYVWFNEGLADDTSETVHNNCYLAGWALGAAVANGVSLPLRLPPVFVKLARQRITGLPFKVAEQDLIDMDVGYGESIATVRAMQMEDFKNYIKTLDDPLDAGSGDSGNYLDFNEKTFSAAKERYIAVGMVEDTIVRRCRKRLEATIDGFRASLVPLLPAAWAVSSERLHTAICGDVDNPSSDFRFADHFNITLASDFTDTPHGKIFGDMILQALEGSHVTSGPQRIAYKRALLKFITGRELLPAHAKTDTIYIECGSICETTIEHAYAIGRLPAAHTCTNAVQIPNYLENLAFGADDAACRTTVGHSWQEKMCIVTKDLLHRGWSRLLPPAQAKLTAEAQELLISKLTLAVSGADTYELDDDDFTGDDSDEDDDEDARRRSSMMRGIPPPRRRNTAELEKELAKRDASNAGSSVLPYAPHTVARAVHTEDEAEYEDPFEDGETAMNPFAPPEADFSPTPDDRRGTAPPSILPSQPANHAVASRPPHVVAYSDQDGDFDSSEDDDDHEPAQSAIPVMSDFGEQKRAATHNFDD